MTKLYMADVTVGKPSEDQAVIKGMVAKKLPVIHLCNEDYFLNTLIKNVGEKKWLSYRIDKKTRLPEIKIVWVKELSATCYEKDPYQDE